MASLDPTLIIVIIFVTVLGIFTLLAFAFGIVGVNNKVITKKLDVIKARHGTSRAMQAARKDLFVKPEKSFFEQFIPKPDEMRKRLKRTGKKITMQNYALASIGLGILLTVIIMIFVGLGLLPSLALGAFVGLFVPHIIISKMIAKRTDQFTKQFPEAIDLMVRGLQAGLPIIESFNAVGQEMDDPIGIEFKTICSDVRMGNTLSEALKKAVDKIDTSDFKFFVISLNIQQETGGNLAETLGNLSAILRGRSQLKLKIKAMSSEGRASATIIGVLPFIVSILIHFSNPKYLAIMFTDPRGQIGLVVAFAMLGFGMFVISKMIDFEI
jgi:tight adherence protein B